MTLLEYLEAYVKSLLYAVKHVEWSAIHRRFGGKTHVPRFEGLPEDSFAHIRTGEIFLSIVRGLTFEDDRGALVEAHRSLIDPICTNLLLEEIEAIRTLAAIRPGSFGDRSTFVRFMTAFHGKGPSPSILGRQLHFGLVERVRNAIDYIEDLRERGEPVPTAPEALLEDSTTWAASIRFGTQTTAHPLHRFEDGWHAIVLDDDDVKKRHVVSVGQPILVRADGSFLDHPTFRALPVSLADETDRPVATIYVDRRGTVTWVTAPHFPRKSQIEPYVIEVIVAIGRFS